MTGLIVAAAIVARLILLPWAAGFPYLTFFAAAVIATFLCGSVAGVLAALLSIPAARFLLLDSGPLSNFRTMTFASGVLVMVAIIAAMRAANANVNRMNETLRLSEEKFRGLLESAPDAMVIVDERHRIVLVNARTEKLFGHHRAALLGQPVEMLMSERSRDAYRALLSSLIRDPKDTQAGLELYGLRSDGREFSIEANFGPVQTEAGILVSSAIRDVTARRQIEVRLTEASRAKSEFLANMSHELRTPLNAIIGFSELIRDAYMGPLDAKYREYAGDINESGRHLQSIIDDILDVSKIEAGRLELRDESVSIAETAEACCRIIEPMAEAADVALSINVSPLLPPIRSDHVRFKQILLNLISNAVKFTPPGGRITVSAWIEADYAVLTVEDTGIGMKPEDIPIALEPFRQIDGALSRRYTGTGLGLSLANALVELHGGRLHIESTPGKGTTIHIRLPFCRMANAAA